MPEERPSFTVETAAPRTVELPVLAWVLANSGVGLAVGAFVELTWCLPTMLPAWPRGGYIRCPGHEPEIALGIAFAALCGAAAFWLLPSRAGAAATIRRAAVFAFAAAAAGLGLAIGPGGPVVFALWGGLGLISACAALTAVRPDAALTPRRRGEGSPQQWLGAGWPAAAALLFGFGLGAAAPVAPPILGLVGAFAMACAGVSLLALGSAPHEAAPSSGPPPEPRGRAVVRLTPMLRHAAAADLGLSFCLTACLVALASQTSWVFEWAPAGAAIATGGPTGAVAWRLWAPRADARLGRGILITAAIAAGAMAPLALWLSLAPFSPPGVFAAAAMAGFALSSAPQRHALTFDLATSRARARTALDLQGLKVGAGAAGALVFLAVQSVAPGMGLPVASAVGLSAIASFAPTLGSLGRRAH